MLNELQQVRHALVAAGVPLNPRHPDIVQVSARGGLFRVQLDPTGKVRKMLVMDAAASEGLWTLRKGKHNSFPYVQLKHPLLQVDPTDERLKVIRNARTAGASRWAALRELIAAAEFNEDAFATWPAAGFVNNLRERKSQLACLAETPTGAVPAIYARFLAGVEVPHELLKGITAWATEQVLDGSAGAGLPLFIPLLLDGGAPLYFDVPRDFPRYVGDERNVEEISRALAMATPVAAAGVCAVTGERMLIRRDNFPQPNLPLLGETYLFARNKDAPTNARYGRTGTESVAIGDETITAPQAAIEALTRDEWKNRTWRGVAGERPKQTDLFVAYVPGAEDVPLASLLSEYDPDPAAEEEFASFAQRLSEAFDGRVLARRETALSLLVLRKVDPANRKVIFRHNLSVEALLDAARLWTEGCQNVPPSVRLPIPTARGQPPEWRPPREVVPFRLPSLTRQQFIRGGTQRQEVVGLTYDEVMRIFLDTGGSASVGAVLRQILERRGSLLVAVGHAQVRGLESLKELDREGALATVTILGLLLHKLGLRKEEYMEDAAYKLGQLLAGADSLHAAYNASERGGAGLPPRLIGNAVLPMAQHDPLRSLDILGRRWAVYHGWADRTSRTWRLPEEFRGKRRKEIDSKRLADYDRQQMIGNGIWTFRRLSTLASDLKVAFHSNQLRVDDQFRAELPLGYIAGPPRGYEHSDSPGNTHLSIEGGQ